MSDIFDVIQSCFVISVSGSTNAYSEPGKFLAFILTTAVVVVKNYWNILS